jgi:hypothetical protein
VRKTGRRLPLVVGEAMGEDGTVEEGRHVHQQVRRDYRDRALVVPQQAVGDPVEKLFDQRVVEGCAELLDHQPVDVVRIDRLPLPDDVDDLLLDLLAGRQRQSGEGREIALLIEVNRRVGARPQERGQRQAELPVDGRLVQSSVEQPASGLPHLGGVVIGDLVSKHLADRVADRFERSRSV